MKIDSHQHFWTRARGDYTWLTPELGAIYRDFGPDDLEAYLINAGIDGTILVQAAATTAETDFMLQIADASARVKGVVGWIDFETPADLVTLKRFAAHPKFCGVRPMIQDIPDIDWALRPDLDWAYRAIIDLDLTFDFLGFPRHLDNALKLLKRYPEMRVVIDHSMKPEIAAGRFEPWAAGMRTLAEETSAFCKLSGLVTEAGPDWTVDRLRPFVAHVLNVFAPDRIMWGSDWPVLNLACTYHGWHAIARDLIREHLADPSAEAKIFGETARTFYRL
jgi:L-fuconolactonase